MSQSEPGRAFAALDTSEPLTAAEIEARARELLSQLTLDEKLKLMCGDLPFWQGMATMFGSGYGSQTWNAGEVPRLGIPGVRFADGPRGIVMKGATTFPVSMARGATWDPDLEERIGDAIGRELRALGGTLFGGVCINLLRHPAWGRAQETYGEDTFHLGCMGAALVRGVQRHVMACVKHYALNSMENARFKVDVTVDERALHEVYLRHFKRAIEAGAASVMSAYNSVNGAWCGQNRTLLTTILKEQWGFAGFVMTDFIFGMRDARAAALAGQDLEMPFAMLFARELKGLVERGEVPLARIDDAALRLLRQQVRFGQGRDPQQYRREVVGCAEHRALARAAAQKSIVLLKNAGNLLPLRGSESIVVIGRLGDTPNTGDGGSSNTQPDYVITPLQGLRAACGTARVAYDDGSDLDRAATAARSAEVALVVVGYTSDDEGEFVAPDTTASLAGLFPPPTPEEASIAQALMQAFQSGQAGSMPKGGDRAHLTLSSRDEALIQAVAAANPRTIVAIMGGSAVVTEAWRGQVPAILMLWYPGMEGGHALADLLLGRVNPSGRLPCSFPASAEQLPFFDRDATAITYDFWHGYRKLDRDGNQPAFPFGFGLSYTSYAYSDLQLDREAIGADERLRVSLTVQNTGAIAGEEVVQLYVAVPHSQVERAPQELKAFARVALAPGEARRVTLELPAAELAYYDPAAGWVVEPATYAVIVGRHARDSEALRGSFEVRR